MNAQEFLKKYKGKKVRRKDWDDGMYSVPDHLHPDNHGSVIMIHGDDCSHYSECFDSDEWELYEDKSEHVNHPSHYNSHPSGVECITVAEHYGFNIGNAIKYLWRNGLKDAESNTQDLEKAVFYIQREIEKMKGGE
jgi:hypothetical protein